MTKPRDTPFTRRRAPLPTLRTAEAEYIAALMVERNAFAERIRQINEAQFQINHISRDEADYRSFLQSQVAQIDAWCSNWIIQGG